jgi:hypothetical protein
MKVVWAILTCSVRRGVRCSCNDISCVRCSREDGCGIVSSSERGAVEARSNICCGCISSPGVRHGRESLDGVLIYYRRTGVSPKYEPDEHRDYERGNYDSDKDEFLQGLILG